MKKLANILGMSFALFVICSSTYASNDLKINTRFMLSNSTSNDYSYFVTNKDSDQVGTPKGPGDSGTEFITSYTSYPNKSKTYHMEVQANGGLAICTFKVYINVNEAGVFGSTSDIKPVIRANSPDYCSDLKYEGDAFIWPWTSEVNGKVTVVVKSKIK